MHKAEPQCTATQVVIYARDGVSACELVEDATSRFNITIDKTIEVGA
jgi:hypothetical protein